jgi:flavin-dependent dehydrogenase
MTFDYDILIAGAGPAGCAAAYDLARAGKRVLLLDRRSFPRPKACACGLTRKTLKALRYSVDPVIERVCKEIVLQRAVANPDTSSGGPSFAASSQRVGSNDVRSTSAPTMADESAEVRIRSRNPICAMAVRERFDYFCLQQTIAAGAQLRKIETIAALRELPTHIELDIVTASGPETLRAPVLIGADGSNGQTRRLAGSRVQGSGPRILSRKLDPGPWALDPDWYTHGFALEALIPYTALPTQLPAGDAPYDLVFDFSPIPGGYGWLFPKGDHINIGVGAFAPADSPDQLKTVTRSLLAAYTQQKLGVGLPKDVTGQHLGMGGHLYVPQGRVLLAGDAAGLVDPLTGEGIHSAIVSGQAAAAAILEGQDIAASYARHLAPLQQTLAFSHRAARAFYKEPERGFRAMKLPFLRSLILKTYADGLPHTRLLSKLLRAIV